MRQTLKDLWRVHTFIFAVSLAFASVVEFAHMRHYMKHGPMDRVVFTGVAAIACGYMASEALEGNWPSWQGNGY